MLPVRAWLCHGRAQRGHLVRCLVSLAALCEHVCACTLSSPRLAPCSTQPSPTPRSAARHLRSPDGFVNPAQGTTLGAGEGSISDYQSAVDTTAMTGYTGSAWNFLTGQIPANTVPTMSYAATSVGFWPTCQPCPVGYIQNSTALVCYKCTYGSTADTGNTQCDGCSAGAYWNGTQCVTVSIGQFAAIGATAASSCNAGTYSAAPGASACDVW